MTLSLSEQAFHERMRKCALALQKATPGMPLTERAAMMAHMAMMTVFSLERTSLQVGAVASTQVSVEDLAAALTSQLLNAMGPLPRAADHAILATLQANLIEEFGASPESTLHPFHQKLQERKAAADGDAADEETSDGN